MIDLRPFARTICRPIAFSERRLLEAYGAKGLTLPTFLTIGAPQSGTTWLYHNLILHPHVSIPIKEVRFFDGSLHRPLLWYSHLYSTHYNWVRGDMSTSYIRLARRQIEFVSRVMPDVNIILLVRNPVYRAWSAYRRWKYRNPEPTTADMQRYLRWSVEAFGSWAQSPLEYSRYSKGLARWQEFFPQKSFCVLSFEDVSNQPAQVVQQALEHIGATPKAFPWEQMLITKVNANPELDMPESIRSLLEQRYAGEHQRLSELLQAKRQRLWS